MLLLEIDSSEVRSGFTECNFLAENTDEINKHQQITAKNMKVIFKKYEMYDKNVKDYLNIKTFKGYYDKSKSIVCKLLKENAELESRISTVKSLSESLSDECSVLSHQVELKQDEVFSLAQSLKELTVERTDLSQDLVQHQKAFRKMFEANKFAKCLYKDRLDFHICILHSDDKVIQFLVTFSKIRPVTTEPIPLDSIKFQKSCSGKTWTLLETNPPHPNFKQLSEKFEEFQDTQGLLDYLRPSVSSRSKTFERNSTK